MKKLLVYSVLLGSLISCRKEKEDPSGEAGYFIQVNDTGGQPQAGATIKLYHSVEDLLAHTGEYLSLETGSNGKASLPANLAADTLICVAFKGSFTSEFLASKYTAEGQTYSVIVEQPSGEQLLCGHDTKNWLMTSYSINGNPQPYVVTSTLNADGTWTDTNGNSGTWEFTNNDTQLVYDYTSSGMVVTFNVLELTATFVRLQTNQSGMTIDMEMTAVD